MFALVCGVVLAASFLLSSNTSLAVAANVRAHPAARGIAETGLALAVRHIKADDDWRDGKTSGQWLDDVDWQGGSFTVRFADDDGDLADDPLDTVDIAVVGRFNGIAHRVDATVAPTPAQPLRLLFAVRHAHDPSNADVRRRSMFEAWGYEVTLIDEDASASDYTDAMVGQDVIYVSGSTGNSQMQGKVDNPVVGVVLEESNLADDTGIAASPLDFYLDTRTYIADNLHPITQGFDLGYLTLADEDTKLRKTDGEVADGARALSTQNASGITLNAGGLPAFTSSADKSLMVIDAGDPRYDGSTAHARRVVLPFGSQDMDPQNLTEDGALIIRRSLEWAAGGSPPRGHIAAWGFDETSGTAVYDAIDDHHALLVNEPANDQPGRIGRAADFDGNDQYAVVQNRPQLNPADAFSVALWVNADSWGNGSRLLSKADDAQYRLWVTGGNLQLDLEGVGTIAAAAPSSNVWHHVAATYDGQELRLYLDGELANAANAAGSIDATDQPLYLAGTGPDGNAAAHFDGTLDDVRLFNRGLAHREVRWLHENASQTGVPQLVASYRFDSPPDDAVPQLVSHWQLNDSGTGDGYEGATGIAHIGRLQMQNTSYMDAYNEADGPYHVDNARPVFVVTNLSGNSPNSIDLSSQAYIHGDLLLGPDGDPEDDVDLDNDAYVSGEIKVAESPFTLPPRFVPDDFAASNDGNQTYNGGTRTWSGDLKFNNVTFNNNAVVNVVGDTRVELTNALTMNNGTINIPEGSSLVMYVDTSVELYNNSVINPDTTGPDRFQIVFVGSNVNDDLTMRAQSSITGQIVGPDDLHMHDDAQVYGSVITRDDIYMNGDNGIHYATGLGDVITGAGGTTGSDGTASGTVDATGLSFGNPSNTEAGLDGQSGDAFEFNGNDAFITVPHHPAYLLDRGAVAVWFNPDNLWGTQSLINKDENGFDSGGHFKLYLNGSILVATLESIDATYTVWGYGVEDEQWQHAAVSFGPGGLRLYLDGVLLDSHDYAGGLGPASGGRGNELPWVFGAAAADDPDDEDASDLAALLAALVGGGASVPEAYEGLLDDVRIYNRPLNASQVAAVLADGTPAAASEAVRFVDTANTDRPVHLPIDSPAAVEWLAPGRLRANSATLAASPSAAPKLNSQLAAADAFSLYAVFAPANTTQDGPARIVSYSDGTNDRNLTLGQEDDAIDARLRAGSASNNGLPALQADDTLEPNAHQRVLVVYDGTSLAIYRNGSLETTLENPGNLDGFDLDSPFMLLNEIGDARPWLGTLEAVDIYNAALDATQRQRVFRGQAPGPAGVLTGEDGVLVTWIENP